MKETANAIVGLVMLAVVYFGSYLAMVTPDSRTFDDVGEAKPVYRVHGSAVEAFYFPAFTLDRQIRPERWPPIPDTGVVIF